MDFNYSFLPVFDSTQRSECGKTFRQTANIGKNFVCSFFLGTTLLAIPVGQISQTIPVVSNYSPAVSIECVSISSDKEGDFLNSTHFIDLLKFDNLKKIECMSAFCENWNGVGGQAFSNSAISVFKEIVEGISKQPSIAPTGRNSLLLQYELEDNSMLAFEVRENRVEMVHVPMGDYSSAVCDVFTENYIEQINYQVGKFYGFK